MPNTKRHLMIILACTGIFIVNLALTQCTAMSTNSPKQEIPATAIATSVIVASQSGTTNISAQAEVVTTPPSAPTLSPTPDAPFLEPGGPNAATSLQSEVECVPPGLAIVKLYWTPAAKPGQVQRVDVTIYSFDTQFDSSAPLSPDQASLVWNQPKGQAIHEWRVLTLQENGWVPSETARFEGPTCIFELQEEEETPVIK